MSSSSDTGSDGKLLKPFTIRRLSGVVRIGPEEYNHTVTRNPEAALTYCDEDDGEKITVGSAFELEQRLDEPRTSAFKLRGEPLHIFDIRRASKAGTTWIDFRDRTRERAMASRVAPPGDLIVTYENPNKSHRQSAGSSIRVFKASTSENERGDDRNSWLKACQPPKAQSSGVSQSPQITSTFPIAHTTKPASKVSSSTLTEEGQRQAREAGAKFNWRPPIRLQTDFDLSGRGQTAENRWASYCADSKAPKLTASSAVSEASKEKSLLESFEEELSKIVQVSGDGKENTARERIDNAASPSKQPQNSTQEDHQPENETPAADLAGPGAVIFDIVSALAGGLQVLGNELTRKLPDIEQGIARAQRDFPQSLNDTVGDALSGVGNMAEMAVNTSTRHSRDVEAAANQLQESTLEAAEGLLRGFGHLVGSIHEVGKILLQDEIAAIREDRSSAHSHPHEHDLPTDKPAHDAPKPTKLPLRSTLTTHPDVEARRTSLGAVGHACRDGCIIGESRTHVKCILREPYTHDHSCSRSIAPSTTAGSHFRSRETETPTEAKGRARSRSPTPPIRQPAVHNTIDLFNPDSVESAKDYRGESLISSLKPLRPEQPYIGVFEEDNTPQPQEPLFEGTGTKQPSTILDQDDTNLDFSVRFPSLVSSPQCSSAKTVRFGDGGSDSFLNDLNPESEIARFPTLSQLNRPSGANVAAAKRISFDSGTSAKTAVPTSMSAPLNKIPGSWPQQEHDILPPADQSSGQFFERMTGRSATNPVLEHHNNLFRSKSITALNPAARLPGPFDPLSDLAHTMREQDRRNRNLRRAGTERVPSALRRPYSERFTGAGRVPWDNFLHSSGARLPQRQERRDPRSTARDLMRPRSLYNLNTSSRPTFFGQNPGSQPLENTVKYTEAKEPVRKPFPQRQPPAGSDSHPPDRAIPQTRPRPQSEMYPILSPLDARGPAGAAVSPRVPTRNPKDKIDVCIDRLKEMGYGQRDAVEMERLRVFAVAADGDVEEAVTVLEEEREAGKGRGWVGGGRD